MNLQEFGGEKTMVNHLKKLFHMNNPSILKGIGDDAAVVKPFKQKMVITTDMICENDHFSLEYFTPYQIGGKAFESSVSDIYAMGAIPRYALVGISLKKDASAEQFRELFQGIHDSAKRHACAIIGGDTTHADQVVVSVTVIGEAKKPILRSGAKPGDLIFVSGPLGASTAGLHLLKNKMPGFAHEKKKHLMPRARRDVTPAIAKIATALEDVSDGLASEVKNICAESNCGAVIEEEKIPIRSSTRKAAQQLGKNALNFALSGGEDFELVFTVHPKNQQKARKWGIPIGTIVSGKTVFLQKNGKKTELTQGGYDHFT
ncbi:MAG: thiamine-phosphate kinase [Candidatus Diapherotrites archaeon]|nr:thiamine-phosphate kinase [Candidatus Diapherotrites archaeon]